MTVVLVVAGHSRGQTERLVLEPVARAIVRANRLDASQVYDGSMPEAFASMLYTYDGFADELGLGELEELSAGLGNNPLLISPEDAVREVDVIFQLLKYGYAGYQSFGGDEAFGIAKNLILKDLSARSDELTTDEHESLVCGRLGFIQDGHLSIGNTRLCRSFALFWNPKCEFQRDEAGFYVEVNGEIRRVASIEDDDPSSYLKPSINENGDIVYVPGTVRPRLSDGFWVDVKYQNDYSDTIRLEPMVSTAQSGPAYERGVLDGMPLLKCRSFEPTDTNLDALNAFINGASRLRNEHVIVVDIRSNPGGSSQYAMAWLWRLTYQQPTSQQITANLTTNTAVALLGNLLQCYSGAVQMPKDAATFLRQNADGSRPGWSSVYHGAGMTVNNEPFIAVITDSFVASAAEGLVLDLRHVDNAVFIGANTGGMLSTGAVGSCRLPTSGLGMTVPVALNRREDITNRDGLGLLPDFWVHPDHALERTARFLRKHLIPDCSGQPQR